MPVPECQAASASVSEVRLEAMIVKVFGDESADQAGARVFAVCGVIGVEDEWAAAKEAWTNRTGGKEFHAAECESEYAYDPRSAEHQENLNLYRDLTQVIARSTLDGIGVALDLGAHRELFGESLLDLGYYRCLAEVLDLLTAWAKNNNECCRPEETVMLEFTFDNRIQSNGNAGNLYSTFINQPELKEIVESTLDSKISFDCRINPRIQIADLLAHETMKELDRLITRNPPVQRRSYQALNETDRFTFLYRDRGYCQEWKANREKIEADSGMNASDYVDWMIETGRVQDGKVHDNWTNRFLYQDWRNRLKSRNA
ncbi:MAG: hypothetical protein ACRD1O_06025 [Terriglobia bacterium]